MDNKESIIKMLASLSEFNEKSLLLGAILLKEEVGLEAYWEILKLYVDCTNFKEVSDVIMAVTALNPHRSVDWLGATRLALINPSVARPDFFLGIILGLFKSAIWLDQDCVTITGFDEKFPEVIAEDMILNGSNLKSHVPTSDYESHLSQQVKPWVRVASRSDSYRGRLGRRVAQVHGVFDTVVSSGQQELTPVGELVLDQITYAEFGSISSLGRARALKLFMDDLTDLTSLKPSGK